MKKILKCGLSMMCILAMLSGCSKQGSEVSTESYNKEVTNSTADQKVFEGATIITLSDSDITVDGNPVSTDESSAVYAANDIVFYLEGQGFTYGEGTEEDEHSQEEADAHKVVHITEPGTYAVNGKLSAGQIAVDLGEEAEDDPEAVVTLILNGVDINCSVAPAVIFYNVYECGSSDAETASKDVDTTAAGANVLIADGTTNNVNGSYVARIYKSFELNEEGTEVVDNKKLHKYDAAFYSKMSMNVNGDTEGTGILNIQAENEGLDSELHLTINGGNIHITSGNDGINTNEDEVSVTTINGGMLTIRVSGETGEGDGIDSNGWLVINGGTVIAEACSLSGDAGIDSDMGIHINGGVVVATGNMLDRISESTQNYAVFCFAESQKGGETYTLKNDAEEIVFEHTPANDFIYLIVSGENLAAGTYTLWMGQTQLAASEGNMLGGRGDMEFPEGFKLPEGMELPEDMELPEGMESQEPGFGFGDAEAMDPGMMRPEGTDIDPGMMRPEGDMVMPEGFELPEGVEPPEGQDPGNFRGGMNGQGGRGNRDDFDMLGNAERSTQITIVDGGNYFSNVAAAE